MTSTTYKLKDAVEINFLDKWEDEGYTQRRPHALRGKLVMEKTFEESFIARRNIKIEKYKVGGTAVALVKAFGWDLLENTTHIKIRGGRVLPITRTDKRVVLSEKPGKGISDIKAGETIQVNLLGARVDRIPVVEVDMSCFVKGEYTPKDKTTPQREIRINGTTTLTVGSRMPEGEGEEFWSEIYDEVEESLLNGESHTDYRLQDNYINVGSKLTLSFDYGDLTNSEFDWASSVESSESDMVTEGEG